MLAFFETFPVLMIDQMCNSLDLTYPLGERSPFITKRFTLHPSAFFKYSFKVYHVSISASLGLIHSLILPLAVTSSLFNQSMSSRSALCINSIRPGRSITWWVYGANQFLIQR